MTHTKCIIDDVEVSDYANYWFDRCCEINRECSKYLQALQEIRKYCEKCKKCVETGDEVILYTILKKINEVIGVE